MPTAKMPWARFLTEEVKTEALDPQLMRNPPVCDCDACLCNIQKHRFHDPVHGRCFAPSAKSWHGLAAVNERRHGCRKHAVQEPRYGYEGHHPVHGDLCGHHCERHKHADNARPKAGDDVRLSVYKHFERARQELHHCGPIEFQDRKSVKQNGDANRCNGFDTRIDDTVEQETVVLQCVLHKSSLCVVAPAKIAMPFFSMDSLGHLCV